MEELARRYLEEHMAVPSVDTLRHLMLIRSRKSEILTLRWEDMAIDEAELRFPDTKTGVRMVSLSPPDVKSYPLSRTSPATLGSSPAGRQ